MKTAFLTLLLVLGLTSVSEACFNWRIRPDLAKMDLQITFQNKLPVEDLKHFAVEWVSVTGLDTPGDTEVYFGYSLYGQTFVYYIRLGGVSQKEIFENKDCVMKIFRESSKEEWSAWLAKTQNPSSVKKK